MHCKKTDAILTIGKNGRTGNNLAQVMKGLYFAAATSISCVHLPTKYYKNSLFDMPEYFRIGYHPVNFEGCANALSESQAPWLRHCSVACNPSSTYGSFWVDGCTGIAANEMRLLADAYIKPHAFFHAPNDDESDKLLTVHLRGGDLLGNVNPVNHWLWAQPPCAMYEKIVAHGNYNSVLVVIDKPIEAYPCVPWFRNFSKRSGIMVRIQSSSVLADARAISRAKNLALSFSTFPESIALVSGNAKRLYLYNSFQENSAMNCKLWSGVTLYVIQGLRKPPAHNNTFFAVREHMLSYKAFSAPSRVENNRCRRNSRGEWTIVLQ